MRLTDKYCRELLGQCQQRFRLKYPEQALLRNVTPEQVREELRTHRNVYLRLMARAGYDEPSAYIELRRAISAGLDPSVLLDERPRWEQLDAEQVVVPRLPSWLKRDIRDFLRLRRREKAGWTSPIPTPFTSDYIGPILLFTARCYRREPVQRAVKLLRRRWRVSSRTDPLAWYQRMNDADKDTANLRPRSPPSFYPDVSRLDPRNLKTYSDYERFRVSSPIADYLQDLRELVRLLGGDAAEGGWVRWAEGLLWDFRVLPWPGVSSREPRLERWKGYPAAQPLSITHSGRVWAAPIFQAAEVRASETSVTVTFYSKYLALDDLSGDLRHHITAAASAVWGDYEERPSLTNVERELRAMLQPHTREEAYAQDADVVPDSELSEYDRRELASARRRRRRHKGRGP